MQLCTLSSGLWMWLLCVDHTLTDSVLSHTSQTLCFLWSLPGNDSFGWPYTETAGAGACGRARARGARVASLVACFLFIFSLYRFYIRNSVIGVFSPLVRFSTHSTESHTNEGVPNILIRPVVSAVGPCPKLIRSSVLGPRQPPQKPNRVPRHVTAPLRPSTTRGASRELAR